MGVKEEIHQLVDQLMESELPAARRFLEYLRDVGSDPVLRALETAPWDDEPESEEERAAVHVAREQIARGEVIPDAELDDWLARERVAQRRRVRRAP